MLREQWNQESLGKYQGQWIAFQNNEILASDADLWTVTEPYLRQMEKGAGPLFAFITFEARA